MDHAAELSRRASLIRQAVNAAGFPQVDHVELFGPAGNPVAQSRNFVLCPGYQYDRSPCGTGLSAKLACLAADGQLQPGQWWIQEGILGLAFRGQFRWLDTPGEKIQPVIGGEAFITAESRLLFAPEDPFRDGIAVPGGED